MTGIPVRTILDAVAAEWGVTADALLAHDKRRALVEPRQVVMWLCRYHSPLSDRAVARLLRRDRKTCDQGERRVHQRMTEDADFLIRVHALERRLREQAARPPAAVPPPSRRAAA